MAKAAEVTSAGVDTGAITTMVASIGAASEISLSMIGLRDMGELQPKLLELNAQINAAQASAFTAQQAQAALAGQVRDLETEITNLKAWETEKARYELVNLTDGVLAYAMKEGMADGTPAHHLCASCFDQGEKSILQVEIRDPGRTEVHVCHRCGSELYVKGSWMPEHAKASRRG